jgi:hypothetical protein
MLAAGIPLPKLLLTFEEQVRLLQNYLAKPRLFGSVNCLKKLVGIPMFEYELALKLCDEPVSFPTAHQFSSAHRATRCLNSRGSI